MTIRTQPDASRALAADVGGTSMRAAVVSRSGDVIGREAIPTRPELGIENAAARLAEAIRRVHRQAGAPPVAAAGVATAGPIDPHTGVYDNPPNLTGWHGLSLKPSLEKALGLQVSIGHDATLAALAETTLGPYRGAQNLLYVTVSTGIGGGIVANGQPVTGSRGGAGEVGYITIHPGEERCVPGGPDSLEGNASGMGIARIARERAAAGEAPAILDLARQDLSAITSEIVFQAANDGDGPAGEIVDHAIESLGIGLGSLNNILDPDAIVLGGGVANALQTRWQQLVNAIVRRSLPDRGDPGRIALTTLGDDVSLLGAAQQAFRSVRR